MKKKAPETSVFDAVMAGLEESISFSEGKKVSPLVAVRVAVLPPPVDSDEV